MKFSVVPRDPKDARSAALMEKALNGFFKTRPIDPLMMFGVLKVMAAHRLALEKILGVTQDARGRKP